MVGIAAVATSLLAGSDGMARYMALRAERQELGGAAVRRLQENTALRAEITRLLRQSGALDYAMTRANEYALAARQKLSAFPDGPERDGQRRRRRDEQRDVQPQRRRCIE